MTVIFDFTGRLRGVNRQESSLQYATTYSILYFVRYVEVYGIAVNVILSLAGPDVRESMYHGGIDMFSLGVFSLVFGMGGAFISLLISVCLRVLSLIVFFIFSMVSSNGVTICPRLVLLDSANSFWRSLSMSSVAVFTCAVTLAIVSLKSACCASIASECLFSWAAIASAHHFSASLLVSAMRFS